MWREVQLFKQQLEEWEKYIYLEPCGGQKYYMVYIKHTHILNEKVNVL